MHRFIRTGLALALLSAPAGVSAAGQAGDAPALPFIDDDYGRALAEARSRNLPLFIETWAPW